MEIPSDSTKLVVIKLELLNRLKLMKSKKDNIESNLIDLLICTRKATTDYNYM